VVPLAPSFIETHSYELIILTSVLLLLGSILVIFNYRFGHHLITLLLVSFCVVIHNPVLYTKENDLLLHLQLLVMNLVIVAGLWMTCEKKDKLKVKTD
jgi:predicted ferric reductase